MLRGGFSCGRIERLAPQPWRVARVWFEVVGVFALVVYYVPPSSE